MGRRPARLAPSRPAASIVYNDDQETPNTQLATLDYGDKQITFEVRGLPSNTEGAHHPLRTQLRRRHLLR